MTSLVKDNSQFKLNADLLLDLFSQFKLKLKNRVTAAYVFGSTADGSWSADSDFDLILVVERADRPFIQRGFDFLDLFDIYPKLDLLIYTQQELDAHLADSALGFWKSVRETMKKIL